MWDLTALPNRRGCPPVLDQADVGIIPALKTEDRLHVGDGVSLKTVPHPIGFCCRPYNSMRPRQRGAVEIAGRVHNYT